MGTKVVLQEPGAGGAPSCTLVPASGWRLGGGEACDPSELALLPPPSWWLRKLLHPYPTPLLEGAGDGVHCTT